MFPRLFDQHLSLAASQLHFHRQASFSSSSSSSSSPPSPFPTNFLALSPTQFIENCQFVRPEDWRELGRDFLLALYSFLLTKLASGRRVNPAIRSHVINDPARGPLHGQNGVFSSQPLPKGTLLCEYGGHVDLESAHHLRVVQMDHPQSDEKTLLLSTTTTWPELLFNSLEDDERTVGSGGGKEPSQHQDRLVVDGFFHPTISSQFNDYRLDPFKEQGLEKDPGVPNCRFVEVVIFGWPHVFIVTEQDVPAEIELTVDYGDPFWDTIRFHSFLSDYATRARREDGRGKAMSFRELMGMLSKL